MSIESIENPGQIEQEDKRSPERLIKVLEASVKLTVNKIEVFGEENLTDIPPDRKVVFAVSHATDLDMPVVSYILAQKFDIAVTNISLQHKLFKDPGMFAAIKIAGKGSFAPIEYRENGSDKPQAVFDPDNLLNLAHTLEENGKMPVIAGHNPSTKGSIEKGGYAVPFIAQALHALIVPIAVQIKAENKDAGLNTRKLSGMLKRPDADVFVGKPFELESIEGIEIMGDLMNKRKSGTRLSTEELETFSKYSNRLREESETVVEKISDLLPAEAVEAE